MSDLSLLMPRLVRHAAAMLLDTWWGEAASSQQQAHSLRVLGGLVGYMTKVIPESGRSQPQSLSEAASASRTGGRFGVVGPPEPDGEDQKGEQGAGSVGDHAVVMLAVQLPPLVRIPGQRLEGGHQPTVDLAIQVHDLLRSTHGIEVRPWSSRRA